ncbi:MAG: hypothetical protein HOY71_43380, partial [Nonomuraea sp.]|nr:hypothetical protein [Nonomuraea sp.]
YGQGGYGQGGYGAAPYGSGPQGSAPQGSAPHGSAPHNAQFQQPGQPGTPEQTRNVRYGHFSPPADGGNGQVADLERQIADLQRQLGNQPPNA